MPHRAEECFKMVLPSTQLVEKKAMFRVSRGFSLVKSGDLVCGSDSPVSEELSTCPWEKSNVSREQHEPHLGLRDHSTPSAPSTEALLKPTLQPFAEMILRSAGIRSPPFTSTRSPTTTSSAFMLIFSPFRITRACFWKGTSLHQFIR